MGTLLADITGLHLSQPWSYWCCLFPWMCLMCLTVMVIAGRLLKAAVGVCVVDNVCGVAANPESFTCYDTEAERNRPGSRQRPRVSWGLPTLPERLPAQLCGQSPAGRIIAAHQQTLPLQPHIGGSAATSPRCLFNRNVKYVQVKCSKTCTTWRTRRGVSGSES